MNTEYVSSTEHPTCWTIFQNKIMCTAITFACRCTSALCTVSTTSENKIHENIYVSQYSNYVFKCKAFSAMNCHMPLKKAQY